MGGVRGAKPGFPGGTSGKAAACQCRKHKRREFDPRVGKILWRRAWQPTPVFLARRILWTEEPGKIQSMGVTESVTLLKPLNMNAHRVASLDKDTAYSIFLLYFMTLFEFLYC